MADVTIGILFPVWNHAGDKNRSDASDACDGIYTTYLPRPRSELCGCTSVAVGDGNTPWSTD